MSEDSNEIKEGLALAEATLAVVRVARAGYDWFTVDGVFTEDDDAAEMAESLNLSQFIIKESVDVQRLPMKTVIEILIEDRLKELASPIKVFAEAYIAASKRS